MTDQRDRGHLWPCFLGFTYNHVSKNDLLAAATKVKEDSY